MSWHTAPTASATRDRSRGLWAVGGLERPAATGSVGRNAGADGPLAVVADSPARACSHASPTGRIRAFDGGAVPVDATGDPRV